MSKVKIAVGAAIAAFLAFNVVGAAVVFGGVSGFERVSNVAGAATDELDFDDFDSERFDLKGEGPGPHSTGEIPPPFEDEFPGAPGSLEHEGPRGEGPPMGKEPKGEGSRGEEEKQYAVEQAAIGADEAEEVALGAVSGRIVETKLKAKDGYPHYEIEVYNDGRLYEVLVGAREGEVVGGKVEDADDAYKIEYLLDQANVDRDEAEQTVTSDFPGLIIESKLDDKDGFAIWEIETFDEERNLFHEAEVNAQNGDILAYETKGIF